MAINHRKLLSVSDSGETTDCSNCSTTCPYDCDYAQIYWPPEPPQLPPSTTTSHDSVTTHLSPYLIVILAVIGSAVLFISYYLIMIRYCTRFRLPSATQVNEELQDSMNEDHRPEIEHPIWYITTVGLQPAVINSITVVKFKKGDRLIDGTDCSVCLSEFEDDESLRLLPKCNHVFHIPCIDTWLRSHTNCPLCRVAVFSNNPNSISQPNDGNRNHGFGSNQITQMENAENNGDLGTNRVQESGNQENRRETGNGDGVEDGSKDDQDSKRRENETVVSLRRSFSMDLATEIVHMELNLSSEHMRDSRTGRMMMRSFSYGGRSII
ncbi:RING-H2 finger protein ATL54-like [Cynara cardunculus var. scolymus]|uniref:RING-type E3 ubiquitin transferase n=1 Tax=Cynara cardunculus var. scolymus TaxID=59895 RepID=A0A118K429_CYNCS|nr:RING-H2 finger protein ATL54-like [Cynara cardunculus var. scolymus]KVI06827.1 Zinc finger, RING/FYVE/PHD-type [Cynara cardunculus var. scolymus]